MNPTQIRPHRGAPYSRVPESLRAAPIWYLTEPPRAPTPRGGFAAKRRLSPVSLTALGDSKDPACSDFYVAFEALDSHRHWFDGLGIQICQPWCLVIFQYAFQSGGKVYNDLAQIIKELGGYFERGPLDTDAQGVLWSPEPVHAAVGMLHGFSLHILTAGCANLSGRHIPGRANDPLLTDQRRLSMLIGEITPRR